MAKWQAEGSFLPGQCVPGTYCLRDHRLGVGVETNHMVGGVDGAKPTTWQRAVFLNLPLINTGTARQDQSRASVVTPTPHRCYHLASADSSEAAPGRCLALGEDRLVRQKAKPR